MIKVKSKFSFLDEDNSSDIVWQGTNAVPGRDTIASSMTKLRAKRKSCILLPFPCKSRNFNETLQWVIEYAYDCHMDLRKTFNSSSKNFEVFLFVDATCSEFNLVFRLITVGAEGWTAFRIAWIKISEDSFLCSE